MENYKFKVGDFVEYHGLDNSAFPGTQCVVLGYSSSYIETATILLGNMEWGHEGSDYFLFNEKGEIIAENMIRPQHDAWWTTQNKISLIHTYLLSRQQIKNILNESRRFSNI